MPQAIPPRLYHAKTEGVPVPALGWIYDPLKVSTDGITTGMWRAHEPGDYQLTVDSVNLSGINVNTDQLETITTSGVRAVTSTFSIITGGQVTIPVGARGWSVGIESGAAYINGVGPYMAQVALNSDFYTATAINVGGTGTVADPTRIYVTYES